MTLLPCPFCGEMPELSDDCTPRVNCRTDGCSMFNWCVKPEQWNTRPSPWISVEERLPAELMRVLVWTDDGAEIGYRYNWRWDLRGSSNPTHWMPLPPAPKEAK